MHLGGFLCALQKAAACGTVRVSRKSPSPPPPCCASRMHRHRPRTASHQQHTYTTLPRSHTHNAHQHYIRITQEACTRAISDTGCYGCRPTATDRMRGHGIVAAWPRVPSSPPSRNIAAGREGSAGLACLLLKHVSVAAIRSLELHVGKAQRALCPSTCQLQLYALSSCMWARPHTLSHAGVRANSRRSSIRSS